jgi:hypothetical protein
MVGPAEDVEVKIRKNPKILDRCSQLVSLVELWEYLAHSCHRGVLTKVYKMASNESRCPVSVKHVTECFNTMFQVDK